MSFAAAAAWLVQPVGLAEPVTVAVLCLLLVAAAAAELVLPPLVGLAVEPALPATVAGAVQTEAAVKTRSDPP